MAGGSWQLAVRLRQGFGGLKQVAGGSWQEAVYIEPGYTLYILYKPYIHSTPYIRRDWTMLGVFVDDVIC